MFKVSFSAAWTSTDIQRASWLDWIKGCYLTQAGEGVCVWRAMLVRVLLLCPLDTHVQISVCAFVHSYAYTLPLFVRVGAVRCIYCYNHFSVCCVCVCVFQWLRLRLLRRWISKFICKSILHFHCGKNWNDQSLERPINKVLGCWFIGRHCGTIASQIISPLTATF